MSGKRYASLLVLSSLIMSSYVNAEQIVDIPCKNLNNTFNKTVIKDEMFDSESGIDFTGNGRPRFYDSMYYNYYLDDPRYRLLHNYPYFYVPCVRGKRK